jgi:hypothetical protein
VALKIDEQRSRQASIASVAGEIRETDCFRACRRPELGIGLDVTTRHS